MIVSFKFMCGLSQIKLLLCALEKLSDFLGTGSRSGAREIWTCLILNSDICERRLLQWTAAMITDTWILALYGMQMRPQTLAHAWGGTISYYQLNQAQSVSSYNDPHTTSVMQNGAYFSLMEIEGGMTEMSLFLSVWFCITFDIVQNLSLFILHVLFGAWETQKGTKIDLKNW